MPKFIKKPIMFEAVQWDGGNFSEILKLTNVRCNICHPGKTLIIRTLEGNMTANVTDWIIKGIKNELYTCKNDIFLATYEKVKNPIGLS